MLPRLRVGGPLELVLFGSALHLFFAFFLRFCPRLSLPLRMAAEAKEGKARRCLKAKHVCGRVGSVISKPLSVGPSVGDLDGVGLLPPAAVPTTTAVPTTAAIPTTAAVLSTTAATTANLTTAAAHTDCAVGTATTTLAAIPTTAADPHTFEDTGAALHAGLLFLCTAPQHRV